MLCSDRMHSIFIYHGFAVYIIQAIGLAYHPFKERHIITALPCILSLRHKPQLFC